MSHLQLIVRKKYLIIEDLAKYAGMSIEEILATKLQDIEDIVNSVEYLTDLSEGTLVVQVIKDDGSISSKAGTYIPNQEMENRLENGK